MIIKKWHIFLGAFGFSLLISCDEAGGDGQRSGEDLKSSRDKGSRLSQKQENQGLEPRKTTPKTNKNSGKEVVEEIRAGLISRTDGEAAFLDWFRANGTSQIGAVVELLRKTGEPGSISPSEEAFCGALVTFYNERDDVFLGELLDQIAYPGVYRGDLVRTFASKVVEESDDPNKALLDLLTRGSPESVNAVHYMKIITDAGKFGDPKKILSEIPDPNDGKIGTAVVSQLAPRILRESPESTIKYFTEMKSSALKDAGTYFLVKYAADMGDFEVARNWVKNSANEAIQAGAIKYIERMEAVSQENDIDD